MVAVLAAVAVVASVLAVGVGAAVAQEAPDNSTDSNTPQGESEETEVVAHVDEDLRVLSYHYNASTSEFVIEFENTRNRGSKSVTVTEAVSRSSKSGGASTFGIRVIDVEADSTTTLRMTLQGASDDPGVMITTPASIEQGSGVDLWAEKPNTGGGGLIRGPASWTDVQLTAAIAGAITLLVILLGVWQKVSEEAHGAEEVDLS